jgi:tRNA(fMet)-specific endonuclease VapC
MIDTNICVYLLKKKHEKVNDRFRMIENEFIGISSITIAELEYGVSKSAFPKKTERD